MNIHRTVKILTPLMALFAAHASMAESYVWTGAGDAWNLFGSGTLVDGYAANWSPNLSTTEFPTTGDFTITANGFIDGYELVVGAPRTINSLAFTGTYAIGLSINGAEDGSTSNLTTFGTAGVTILSISGNTGASTVTFKAAAPIALGYTGRSTVDIASGGVLNISSAISGTGGLIKTGAGTLNLRAVSTYTGGISILGGVVTIDSVSRLGAAPATAVADQIVINGGTLAFVAGNVPITDTGETRGVQVGSSVGTVEVQGSLSRTISGIITDVSGQAGVLRKTGTGTLTIATQTNTFTGGLQILEGTVAAASSLRLGAQLGAGTTINGGILAFTNTTALFSVADRKYLVGSNVGTISIEGAGSQRIRGSVVDVAGQVGILRKTGTGTIILDGTQSYTGGTQLNAGTLILASTTRVLGGVTSVTGLTVASGATFAGTGTISGASTFNAGSILKTDVYNSANAAAYSISNVIGNLTFSGGLNIAGMAAADLHSLYFDLGATTASDKITVSGGTFAIGFSQLGMSDFTFTAQTGFDAGIYTLVTSQSLVGSLLSSDTTGTLNGFNTTLQIVGNELQLVVTSAVPEPATWAAIAGAGALAFVIARRMRRGEAAV